jgi:hypothetical protein
MSWNISKNIINRRDPERGGLSAAWFTGLCLDICLIGALEDRAFQEPRKRWS